MQPPTFSRQADLDRSRCARSIPIIAGLSGILVLTLSGTIASAQTQTADYQVVFEATWSAATHPNEFPIGAHFSPLVGGNHGASVSFWGPGSLASLGIERMAEMGDTSALRGEIEDEVAAGFAEKSFVGSGIPSPGSTTLTFRLHRSYPLVTLVAMLAPSPDWFVGVHDLALFDQGWWLPEVTVELLTYDSGTDHGVTYTSPNADANPAVPIAIQAYPLEIGVPVGTMTFRRVPEPDVGMQLVLGAALVGTFARRRSRGVCGVRA